jgi:hypothetical protein
MFLFTLGGWLLFREQDFSRLQLYASLPWELGDAVYIAATGAVLTITLAGGAFLIASLILERVVLVRLRGTSIWPLFEGAFWAGAALAIFLFARDTANEFIYFQF